MSPGAAASAARASSRLAVTCSLIACTRAISFSALTPIRCESPKRALNFEAGHRYLELLGELGQMAHGARGLFGAVARMIGEIEHAPHVVADFAGHLGLLLTGH